MSHLADSRRPHVKVLAGTFLAIGIANLILMVDFIAESLKALNDKLSGAGGFFGGFIGLLMSIPLALAALLYLLCGFGLFRHNKVGRYGAMAMCVFLLPSSWPLILMFMRFSQLIIGAVLVFSLYGLWVLIFRWKTDNSPTPSG